jgi:hypothetical protein
MKMVSDYDEESLVGIFYFIDPEVSKNQKYYQEEMDKMADAYGVALHLFYGKEFFEHLHHGETWDEILKHLEKWKTEIPDFPETNFDTDAKNSFLEIKDLPPSIYRTIFQDEVIFNEIVLTLFPEKKTLKLLQDYFRSKSAEKKIYQTLADLLQDKLQGNNRFL